MTLLLEPLSTATREVLSPLQLREWDYLFLWMDPKGDKFIADLGSYKDGKKVSLHPSYEARGFFKRIPEQKFLGGKDWDKQYRFSLAPTDYTALVIQASWPEDRIIFKDPDGNDSPLAKLQYEFLLKRFASQEKKAAMLAAFKISGALPEKLPNWIDHPTKPLSDYQRVGCQFAINQEGAALLMDKGTGKTATSIARICYEARAHKSLTDKQMRVLVVCPQQVLTNWKEEFHRFATARGKITLVRGNEDQRIKQLVTGLAPDKTCDYAVIVVSYDTLSAAITEFSYFEWDLVILDESQKIKSPRTERWKSCKAIREKSKRRMILTATPIGNSPMDLWTQLEFLGEGLSGFQSFEGFRNCFGVWEDVPGMTGVAKLIDIKNVPLLQERLARLTFQITKEEAGLNLPNKVYDVVDIEMTPKQAKIYSQIATALMAEIENTLSGQTNSLTVEHVLTSLLRLAQITAGHVSWDAKKDPQSGMILVPRVVEQIDDENPKIQACIDLLTEEGRDPNGKTIIWCNFREDIRAISARLKKEGIKHGTYFGDTPQEEREAHVKSFNCDPQFKVLVANPQTAGEGLNLLGYDKDNEANSNTYCDHEIFFSQNWSFILRSQAEDRAHRRGTKMPVRITDLIVPGTIDEEIRARVQGKEAMAASVTDLKSILKRIAG